MLQACLQAGGMLAADQAVVPMGVKGILSGGTRSLRRQQQQHRALDDQCSSTQLPVVRMHS